MAMLNAARRLSAGSALSDSLRYTSSWRFFSTSFREERDTFGPILVPSDKFVDVATKINHIVKNLVMNGYRGFIYPARFVHVSKKKVGCRSDET
ncbi:hypothetical protein KY290_037485 [Solanum tuberosum]|uniref:Uncharacterized protein n=1 Tax=Solanum tuberosum TaxID=4113 RepID=A0ABQ7TWA0_SOLTU|nr:hypothetical protein KY290_037485 [Solanum tuberosum]